MRVCESLKTLSINSLTGLHASLFLQPSCLDNLTRVDFEELARKDQIVSSLATFLPRAKQLKSFSVVFLNSRVSLLNSPDADISAVIEAIVTSRSIQVLFLSFELTLENDLTLLLKLISQSKSINHFYFGADHLKDDELYLAFEYLERSDSIVKFHLRSDPSSFSSPPDYKRIAECVRKCPTVNDVDFFRRDEDEEYDQDASNALDTFYETCSNLDRIQIKDGGMNRPGRESKDWTQLFQIARTFAGAKLTKKTKVPRELFTLILNEGFKHLSWFDNQLSVVIRALLNRRTLGIIYGDVLPLSRPYLYVRCRDALEKIRSSE